jgi:hypothetical protein
MIKYMDVHIHVTLDGKVMLADVPDLQPGDYDAVLLIETLRIVETSPTLDLPVIDLGPWPDADVSLRREDLYGDDGR